MVVKKKKTYHSGTYIFWTLSFHVILMMKGLNQGTTIYYMGVAFRVMRVALFQENSRSDSKETEAVEKLIIISDHELKQCDNLTQI